MSSKPQAQMRQGVGRLSIGSALVVLSGVVGVVFSFFHWYGFSTATTGTTYLNGWHNWGVVSVIVLLVAALVGLGRLAGMRVGTPIGEAILMTLLGVASAVSTIIFMLTQGSGLGAGYDKGPLFGAYIGLICGIVLAIGGLLEAAEARK